MINLIYSILKTLTRLYEGFKASIQQYLAQTLRIVFLPGLRYFIHRKNMMQERIPMRFHLETI